MCVENRDAPPAVDYPADNLADNLTDHLTDHLADRLADTLGVLRRMHNPGSPADRAGISPPLASTLGWLLENDGAPVSGIARASGTTRPTATATVNRLERNGFVGKIPDDTDGRGVRVHLTPGGRRLAEEIVEYRRENMARLLRSLPIKDQEKLVGLLERAVSSVTAERLSDHAVVEENRWL